ncbi:MULTISPECIES: spore coat protein [Sporomusa]|uniref:spore coat protein n=1 Tax=Sporomusa TaxID=2375 RepID=UPI0016699526|nr:MULTISPECIES: spore coat protein [Sporomusa]MCM0759882.1 spore coat protein [Sporomusa sphaeroides DSM 2875]HML34621.1 spore coat protein [Sporomusa sphaeroides]
MPITESMPGTSTMADKNISFDMLKDSEFCLMSLTKAAMEATNKEFRQVITQSLQQCIQEHFQISDLLIQKGWAHPYEIKHQFTEDIQMSAMVTAPYSNIKM